MAHSLRLMVGKLLWQKLEAAGHISSTVRRQKEINTNDDQLVFSCNTHSWSTDLGMMPSTFWVSISISTNQILTIPQRQAQTIVFLVILNLIMLNFKINHHNPKHAFRFLKVVYYTVGTHTWAL